MIRAIHIQPSSTHSTFFWQNGSFSRYVVLNASRNMAINIYIHQNTSFITRMFGTFSQSHTYFYTFCTWTIYYTAFFYDRKNAFGLLLYWRKIVLKMVSLRLVCKELPKCHHSKWQSFCLPLSCDLTTKKSFKDMQYTLDTCTLVEDHFESHTNSFSIMVYERFIKGSLLSRLFENSLMLVNIYLYKQKKSIMMPMYRPKATHLLVRINTHFKVCVWALL